MNLDLFGAIYIAVLVGGTGLMQVVGIVIAIRQWLDRQPGRPDLGVRASLLSPDNHHNDEVHDGQQSSGRSCNV